MILPGIGAAVLLGSTPYPTVRGVPQTTAASGGTTFEPTLPTHVAGDVLLVFVGDPSTSTPSVSDLGAGATWMQRDNTTAAERLGLYILTATGSGHRLVLTYSGTTGPNRAIAYALTGAQGAVLSAFAAGNSPPSLTTSWGAGTLWMAAAVGGNTGGDITPINAPTGFSDFLSLGSASFPPWLAVADRNDGIATIDPDNFTSLGSNPRGVMTLTIAVRPK